MKTDVTCKFCGLPFAPAEPRVLHPDGSRSHETSHPDSMARCRNELVRLLHVLLQAARAWI